MQQEVELEVISNDGNVAICRAYVNGIADYEVSFEREEDSKADFLKVFAVGSKAAGKRFESDAKGLEDAKQKAFESRSATKQNRCNGKEQ